ncbi:MAG: alpha/beta hydrolase, partial [Actinomycetota bacterium]|nr:alpha/beta hydrolase [Actinomycetota bacterium]
ILQAALRPDAVAGLVLVDPALPPVLSARPDPRVFATFAAFLVPAVGRRQRHRLELLLDAR